MNLQPAGYPSPRRRRGERKRGYTDMKNKTMKRLAVLALVCVMVMVCAIACAASYSKVYGQTQERVRVRESASTNATIIDNIVKSACVYVTSSKTSGSSTFIQVKYRANDGQIATGWICQNDGRTTYVKILSADQAKRAFSVSGGSLPSKKVGTFTVSQRSASTRASDSTYIRLGSSGATVRDMQTKLKALGIYYGDITGNVGSKTEAAIKAFQKKNGLTADGIAGPQTLAKIDAAYAAKGGSSSSVSSSSSTGGLKLGSSGADVRDLQTDLTVLGYYWADITGSFGSKTEAAVKAFQKAKGLTADGVAGSKTIAAISKAIAAKGGSTSSSTSTSASGTALKLNSRGDKVSQLQKDLETLGFYYADITGNFGSKTEAAVKAFQKKNGLTADGIAGSKTLAAIDQAIAKTGGSSSSGSSSSSATGMKLGTTSDAVRDLQTDLTTLGFYYGDITGHFGAMTEKAVEKFQKSRGLTQDGVAGAKTLAAIASALKSSGSSSSSSSSGVGSNVLREGSTGDAVAELQTMLKSLGYYYGDITGSFGDLTRKAVRSFQDKEGLTVDGIAGSATLNKLRSLTGSSSGSGSGSAVTTANSYGRLTKDNVYLRSSASTSSSAKASLDKGDLCRITSIKTVNGVKWYYITIKDSGYTYTGYVRSDMMETITEAEYNAAGGNSSSNIGDRETLGMIKVTGDNVALRYSPSKDAEKVGSADKGDTFYYVDTVAGWFQTKSGYWISSSYATVLKDSEVDDYIGSSSSTTYKLYSTGATVLHIQTALDVLGYYDAELTGHFGPKTETAVKKFQKDYGLDADGVVGSKTLAKINEKYYEKIGSTSKGTYNTTIYNISWPDNYTSVFKKLGITAGNKKATLTDITSGLTFDIYIQSAGPASHADAEPLTAGDTATMCRIYGVSTSSDIPWTRRAMVMTIGGYQFVCSIYGEEHGADDIGGNNYSGQFCIHFKDSKINSGDGGSVPDSQNHQAIIKDAVTKLEKMETTNALGEKVKIQVSTTAPSL